MKKTTLAYLFVFLLLVIVEVVISTKLFYCDHIGNAIFYAMLLYFLSSSLTNVFELMVKAYLEFRKKDFHEMNEEEKTETLQNAFEAMKKEYKKHHTHSDF